MYRFILFWRRRGMTMVDAFRGIEICKGRDGGRVPRGEVCNDILAVVNAGGDL